MKAPIRTDGKEPTGGTAMCLTKTAIRAAVPLPKPEAFGRYLFVGPHPDDVESGAGATAAKLAEAGKSVTFLRGGARRARRALSEPVRRRRLHGGAA